MPVSILDDVFVQFCDSLFWLILFTFTLFLFSLLFCVLSCQSMPASLWCNYHSVRLSFCSCWQDWFQKEMGLRKNQLFLPYLNEIFEESALLFSCGWFNVKLNVKCLHLDVVLVMSMLIGVVIWIFPPEYCSLCFKRNLRFCTLSVIAFITFPCLWLVNRFLFSVFVFDLILIISHLLFSCLKFPTARWSFWNGWNR